MNKENAFLAYLKSRKEIFFVAFLLLSGIALLLLGGTDSSFFSEKKEVSYEKTVETEVENLLRNVRGVGEVSVLIRFEDAEKTSLYGQSSDTSPRVASVTVVCDGGDNATVCAELTKMLSAHFGIGANRVTVLKRKA